MSIVYSAREARARFAEMLRQVQAGKTVTISYRGEAVAEVRPAQTHPVTITERLEELERRGVLIRSDAPRQALRAVAHRPDALDRFLDER